MAEFMIDCSLLDAHSEVFMRLIPAQREMVNELMFEGKITGYCVSLNRKKLWMTCVGESEEDIIKMIAKFPLIEFMELEIHALLFINTPQRTFAQISLN